MRFLCALSRKRSELFYLLGKPFPPWRSTCYLVLFYLRVSSDLSRRKVKVNQPRRKGPSATVVKDYFTGVVRDLTTDGRGVVQAPDG